MCMQWPSEARRVLDLLELELKVWLSYPMLVLGTKPLQEEWGTLEPSLWSLWESVLIDTIWNCLGKGHKKGLYGFECRVDKSVRDSPD